MLTEMIWEGYSRVMKSDQEQLNTGELLQIVRRIPAYTKLVYAIYRDPDIPNRQKALVAAALGYLVSPIDIAPGFIPVVGQLDDIIVMLTLLRKALRGLEPTHVERLGASSGITMEMVERDLAEAKRAAWILARKAGSAAAHGAKLALRCGAAAVRSLRRKPPPPNWPPPDYSI